jgi:hypothetical protein
LEPVRVAVLNVDGVEAIFLGALPPLADEFGASESECVTPRWAQSASHQATLTSVTGAIYIDGTGDTC